MEVPFLFWNMFNPSYGHPYLSKKLFDLQQLQNMAVLQICEAFSHLFTHVLLQKMCCPRACKSMQEKNKYQVANAMAEPAANAWHARCFLRQAQRWFAVAAE